MSVEIPTRLLEEIQEKIMQCRQQYLIEPRLLVISMDYVETVEWLTGFNLLLLDTILGLKLIACRKPFTIEVF